jgi:glycosyltransferase involved in cell wall biosynthesis
MGVAKRMKKLKAGFFNPYLDTLGGGERYTLTLAEHLIKKGWEVDVFGYDPQIKKDLMTKFNLKIERVNFVPGVKSLLKRIKMTRKYDLFFWLSDGSIPFLFSRNNLLHFQVPFHGVQGCSFLNRIKLKKMNHFVCNSQFTKKFIDREFGVKSKVIYPPVDVATFSPGKKKNLILSVGRFSQLLQAKRQDILVASFKTLCDQGLEGWQLIIAGATGVGGREYFNQLKRKTKGYPIQLRADIDFRTLKKLYSEAKIFWSASGYGIDEEKEPEKVEHFGITIVEAMAAGCVPVVVGKGGAKEIIKKGKNGFLWEDEKELIRTTRDLIINTKTLNTLLKVVVKSSQEFSKKKFSQEFDELITPAS